jgi:hypothetical protein
MASLERIGTLGIMQLMCVGLGQFSHCQLNFTALDPAFFDKD